MIDKSSIRDDLARERTALANERTLLAYGRTALGIIAIALFVFKFAPSSIGVPLGTFILVPAICLWLWGVRRYRFVVSRISDDQLTLSEIDPAFAQE